MEAACYCDAPDVHTKAEITLLKQLFSGSASCTSSELVLLRPSSVSSNKKGFELSFRPAVLDKPGANGGKSVSGKRQKEETQRAFYTLWPRLDKEAKITALEMKEHPQICAGAGGEL